MPKHTIKDEINKILMDFLVDLNPVNIETGQNYTPSENEFEFAILKATNKIQEIISIQSLELLHLEKAFKMYQDEAVRLKAENKDLRLALNNALVSMNRCDDRQHIKRHDGCCYEAEQALKKAGE